jgi:ribosome-associated protein
MKFATDKETLERESEIEFFKSTGPGGQHRNKRETAVRLTHLPSGIVVTATERRSQSRNREEAFARLAERLKLKNRRKKRRVPTKVSAGANRRRLDKKQRVAKKKKGRQSTGDDGW